MAVISTTIATFHEAPVSTWERQPGVQPALMTRLYLRGTVPGDATGGTATIRFTIPEARRFDWMLDWVYADAAPALTDNVILYDTIYTYLGLQSRVIHAIQGLSQTASDLTVGQVDHQLAVGRQWIYTQPSVLQVNVVMDNVDATTYRALIGLRKLETGY